MTITGMLGQSGLLTLLGMCVVFGFIIILILCMKLLQVVVQALKLDKVEQKDTTASANTTSVTDEKAVVAAIAAAIREKK